MSGAPAGGARARAAAAIVRVCRRLYARGLVAGPDGNVSVRLGDGSILVTPAGMSKVDVRVPDLVLVDAAGTVLAGTGRPSSELTLHLRIYERRSDVHAIVHAHPPTATGFSVAGESIPDPVLPEVIAQMGAVPLVPYATPGTEALARACEPYIDRCDAFLMANHGATTLGATLQDAHRRMESLEHAAKIVFVARTLGRVNRLSESDADMLRGSSGRHAAPPPPLPEVRSSDRVNQSSARDAAALRHPREEAQ